MQIDKASSQDNEECYAKPAYTSLESLDFRDKQKKQRFQTCNQWFYQIYYNLRAYESQGQTNRDP